MDKQVLKDVIVDQHKLGALDAVVPAVGVVQACCCSTPTAGTKAT